MTREELDNKWIEECKKHPGNLEQPLRGCIMTPLCFICKHFEAHRGTHTPAECFAVEDKAYFENVKLANTYECEKFEVDPESDFLGEFDDDYNPLPPDQWKPTKRKRRKST